MLNIGQTMNGNWFPLVSRKKEMRSWKILIQLCALKPNKISVPQSKAKGSRGDKGWLSRAVLGNELTRRVKPKFHHHINPFNLSPKLLWNDKENQEVELKSMKSRFGAK